MLVSFICLNKKVVIAVIFNCNNFFKLITMQTLLQ
jgi:hypothetical protein